MAETSLCKADFCQFLASLVRADFNPIQDPAQLSLFTSLWDDYSRSEPEEWTGRIADLRTVKEMDAGSCKVCKFALDRLRLEHQDLDPEAKVFVLGYETGIALEVWWSDDATGATYGFPLTFLTDTDAVDAKASHDAVRPLNLAEVDYGRIESWIEHCKAHHLETCGSRNSLVGDIEGDTLRVYDLQQQCLARINWLDDRYISLSYVWGNARPPRLTKAEEKLWSQPGALAGYIEAFPLAIQDALVVTGRLGVRYFWFDSLCLIQDDADDLVKGIDSMHLIYERAYLTIVAAHAPDANSGLPGVSAPRQPQICMHIGGHVSLAATHQKEGSVEDSRWATRGWTLQEQILSRRTLTFTPRQVYYHCSQSGFCEEECTDVKPDDRIGETSSKVNFGKTLERYMRKASHKCKIFELLFRLLSEYTARELSYDTDTLRAMTGFLQRVLLATGTPFVQGLPAVVLPASLMFVLEGRKVKSDMPPRRKPGFPSYSWAGWDSVADWNCLNGLIIGYDYRVTEQWLREANWIEWMVLTEHQQCRKVEGVAPGLNMALPRQLLERSGGSALEAGVMKAPSEDDLAVDDASWMTYPCLFFSTLVFRVKLVHVGKRADNDVFEAVLTWNAENTSGRICGAAVLDDSSHAAGPCHVDCLVLSERWTFGVEEDEDDDDDAENLEETDPATLRGGSDISSTAAEETDCDVHDPLGEDRQFNILLVAQVREDNVYERRGVGWVHSSAITRSFPPGLAWKRIILA